MESPQDVTIAHNAIEFPTPMANTMGVHLLANKRSIDRVMIASNRIVGALKAGVQFEAAPHPFVDVTLTGNQVRGSNFGLRCEGPGGSSPIISVGNKWGPRSATADDEPGRITTSGAFRFPGLAGMPAQPSLSRWNLAHQNDEAPISFIGVRRKADIGAALTTPGHSYWRPPGAWVLRRAADLSVSTDLTKPVKIAENRGQTPFLLVGEPESQGELPHVAMPDLTPNLLCSLGLFLCHVDATRLATVL